MISFSSPSKLERETTDCDKSEYEFNTGNLLTINLTKKVQAANELEIYCELIDLLVSFSLYFGGFWLMNSKLSYQFVLIISDKQHELSLSNIVITFKFQKKHRGAP